MIWRFPKLWRKIIPKLPSHATTLFRSTLELQLKSFIPQRSWGDLCLRVTRSPREAESVWLADWVTGRWGLLESAFLSEAHGGPTVRSGVPLADLEEPVVWWIWLRFGWDICRNIIAWCVSKGIKMKIIVQTRDITSLHPCLRSYPFGDCPWKILLAEPKREDSMWIPFEWRFSDWLLGTLTAKCIGNLDQNSEMSRVRICGSALFLRGHSFNRPLR